MKRSWFGTQSTPRLWIAFAVVVGLWGFPFLAIPLHEHLGAPEALVITAAWIHFAANVILLVGLPFTFRSNPVIGRLSLLILFVTLALAVSALGD